MLNKDSYDIDDCVKQYMKHLKPFNALKKDEEHKLLIDYKYNNDINARNKLITSNLKFACKLANKYRNRGIPFSHLISEANSALIYAIDKFDENKDVKLMSYARWWVEQRINALIDNKNKMPEDELPTEHDNQMLNENADFSNEYSYDDTYLNSAFIDEEDKTIENDINTFLESVFTKIDSREKDIINMKFGRYPYEKEYTLEEIGFKYHLTKERTRQILEKAFTKLRSQAMLTNCKFLMK